MPTARFTIVQAPLEEQLADRARSSWARFGTRENTTRAEALQETLAPGGLSFALACMIVALVVTRHLVIRTKTRSILRAHIEGLTNEQKTQ
tara:strand:- start:324 stop:596 length:273 start_codon:yes stop_codon:yes gene_type:complete